MTTTTAFKTREMFRKLNILEQQQSLTPTSSLSSDKELDDLLYLSDQNLAELKNIMHHKKFTYYLAEINTMTGHKIASDGWLSSSGSSPKHHSKRRLTYFKEAADLKWIETTLIRKQLIGKLRVWNQYVEKQIIGFKCVEVKKHKEALDRKFKFQKNVPTQRMMQFEKSGPQLREFSKIRNTTLAEYRMLFGKFEKD